MACLVTPMTDDRTREAAFALHRFGLGPRPGSIAAIASDPRGALLAELERPGAGAINNPDLLTSAQASRAGFEARAARQAQNVLAQRAQKEAERLAAEQGQGMSEEAGKMAEPAKPAAAPQVDPAATPERQNFLKEVRVRLDAALLAEIGFAERLVWFWSNHFCISRDVVPNMAGGYEREAIRPHILGRFADMLLAVEGHPAMLVYLNNQVSIGPNSVAGINRTRGLNENLAREILELHTLGVRTGYSQTDVFNFAKVLTGWTILPPVDNPEHGAEFVFNARMHEPGPQQVIDKTYPDTGVEQGRAVLADVARNPATATHIATKLARHFAADDPPQPLVERLAPSAAAEIRNVSSTGSGSSASRCGNRPPPRVSPMPKGRGSMASAPGSISLTTWRSASPDASNPAKFSPMRSDRWRRPKHARRSRSPKAASRRSRLRSWRPNSNGGEDAGSSLIDAPGLSDWLGRIVRLGAHAAAGARRGPRSACPGRRAAGRA